MKRYYVAKGRCLRLDLATGKEISEWNVYDRYATDIYVDAKNGRDDWPGTHAEPVKTLSRASQVADERVLRFSTRMAARDAADKLNGSGGPYRCM
jgi:hypothetical protein